MRRAFVQYVDARGPFFANIGVLCLALMGLAMGVAGLFGPQFSGVFLDGLAGTSTTDSIYLQRMTRFVDDGNGPRQFGGEFRRADFACKGLYDKLAATFAVGALACGLCGAAALLIVGRLYFVFFSHASLGRRRGVVLLPTSAKQHGAMKPSAVAGPQQHCLSRGVFPSALCFASATFFLVTFSVLVAVYDNSHCGAASYESSGFVIDWGLSLLIAAAPVAMLAGASALYIFRD